MAARILAVLASALLVGAVALAVLAPRGMTLGQALLLFDQGALDRLRAVLASPVWLWPRVFTPLLVRPAWLLPAEIGIVFGGAALTLSWLRLPDKRHRRS